MRHRWSVKGSVLPLFCVLLPFLLVFFGVQGERLLTGMERIRLQREADSLALMLVNEQARALNAIAALNEGLRIAMQRAYVMGVSAAAVFSCAAFLVPSCVQAAPVMVREARSFFEKLRKLGRALAEQQDQIAVWGARAPMEFLERYNVFYSLHSEPKRGFLFPREMDASNPGDSTKLHIHRAGLGAEVSDLIGLESGRFLEDGDIVHCRRGAPMYSDFQDARVRHQSPYQMPSLQSGDRIHRVYRNENGFRDVDIEPVQPLPLQVGRDGQTWTYSHMVVERCRSLRENVGDLGSGFLPAPYVLDSIPHRFTVLLKRSSRQRPLSGFLQPVESHNRPSLWVLAEAEVAGEDLSKMEFQAGLQRVRNHRKLWADLAGQTTASLPSELPSSWGIQDLGLEIFTGSSEDIVSFSDLSEFFSASVSDWTSRLSEIPTTSLSTTLESLSLSDVPKLEDFDAWLSH